MIEKSLMKQHYLKNKNFITTWLWKTLQMQITCMEKEFVKILKRKLDEYHDLYFKGDTLLFLVDVFENVWKMRFKICELYLHKFLSASGLAWQATWKRQKSN